MSNRTVQYQDAVESLHVLADHADGLALRGLDDDDWMAAANAESARALRELAAEAAVELRDRGRSRPGIDELKAPLLAAVGAADLALATVNEIVFSLRERAEVARTDAEARIEEGRARLTKLQEDLPTQFEDVRDKFTSEELRKVAEGYADQATATYNKLVERGEAALERLRDTPAGDEGRGGSMEQQPPGVAARNARIVGAELPKTAPAKKAAAKAVPAQKATAKKAPAKKAAAKRVSPRRK